MRPIETNDEIEQLKGWLAYHQARCREIREALNKHRVKCPGCRCQILPGDECSCCVSTAIFTEECLPAENESEGTG